MCERAATLFKCDSDALQQYGCVQHRTYVRHRLRVAFFFCLSKACATPPPPPSSLPSQVFALPQLTRVFSGELRVSPSGMPAAGAGSSDSRAFFFAGLASDPSGTALVACGSDSTEEVRVFDWPLAVEGFPELQ